MVVNEVSHPNLLGGGPSGEGGFALRDRLPYQMLTAQRDPHLHVVYTRFACMRRSNTQPLRTPVHFFVVFKVSVGVTTLV